MSSGAKPAKAGVLTTMATHILKISKRLAAAEAAVAMGTARDQRLADLEARIAKLEAKR
jgi:hypothetical protein